ncbi:MAG: UvrD-helicase domain-containing protein [Cardiobacteriaceae bacterium]|nr:UvrD-helicase domain-containing protein [Cardiobacteriaceae bacterium]
MKPSPALSSPLFGKVLIEASAGTGKTWTLSAIIIRLLLERGALPKHLIATTFTRKAAAELKRRIHRRLQEVAEAYQAQSALQPEQRLSYQLNDALLQHLFSQASVSQNTWQALGLRLQTSLMQIEQMYIGTLDGLCQKWLLENRLETGADERQRFVEDSQLAHTLTHHQLRAHHHHIAKQNPEHYANYLQTQALDSETLFHKAKSALTFSRATLIPPAPIIEQTAPQFPSKQAFQQWFEPLQSLPVNRNSFNAKRMAQIANLGEGIIEDSATLIKLLQEPPFNKGAEALRNAFIHHPITKQLLTVLHHHQAQAKIPQTIAQSALYEVAHHLRQALPTVLEQQNLTTFQESLQRLNIALEQHPKLAQQIHHRYPIILVDESQDLNDEQSALLEKLYLQHQTKASYLLLVGDPKQAIYQFRGGDVENYQRLKALFTEEERYQLTENHRSNQPLLNALNHHYAQSPELGKGIQYHEVHAANPEPQIISQPPRLEQMYWLNSSAAEECANIAQLISHLLSPQSAFSWKDGRRLQARDILVLMPKSKQLDELQAHLNQHQLSAELQSERSIFESPIAEELGCLLQAMHQPRHQAWHHRLLSGAFYALPLSALQQHDTFALSEALIEAEQRWKSYGLLSALHPFLQQQRIWHTLATQAEARQWVSDLRRLLEVIAERAKHLKPEALIVWWQQQLHDQSTAEWAQPYPSLSPQTIRLMTIHKAKGLQAPVVIVGGLGRTHVTKADDLQLFHYYQQQKRFLSATPPDETLLAEMNQASHDESARLLYVALTRAEQLLFVYRRPKDKDCSEALLSLYQAGEHPNLCLDYPQPNEPQSALPPEPYTPEPSLEPTPKIRHFYGSYRSSFSALTAEHHEKGDASSRGEYDTEQPDHDQHAQSALWLPAMESDAPLPFQHLLPRGAQAGSFMHHVLEQINPRAPQSWAWLLQRLAMRYQIIKADERLEPLEQYEQWLQAIVQLKLEGSGACLHNLNPKALCRELSFTLSLKNDDFSPQALNQLFARYGKALYLDENDTRHYPFLRGEIDLVYEHEGRYFVVDYKTNQLPHYAQSALVDSMNQHQYWLQAALYQLALYRFLKTHRPSFSPTELGGVNYLYLRGLAQHLWSIPAELLLELDALLG